MKYVPSRDLFDDLFNGFFSPRVISNETVMRTDIYEKDGYYHLEIELPGYNKEDVDLEISEGYLTISAKHEASTEEKDAKGRLLRSERSFGTCSRSFYVGDNIKAEDISAKFESGMLEISVPSRETKRIETTRKIDIL